MLAEHRAQRVGDLAQGRSGFHCGNHEIFQGVARHPAGDPRRLIAWLVARTLETGHSIPARTVLTTGSYTPLYMASEPGIVRGTIEGLGNVEFEVR